MSLFDKKPNIHTLQLKAAQWELKHDLLAIRIKEKDELLEASQSAILLLRDEISKLKEDNKVLSNRSMSLTRMHVNQFLKP
jgi:hypothetical protein